MAHQRRQSYQDSDMIVNYHDAVVYGSDLQLLESPTAWLNDAAIHFHFTYLQQHDAGSQDRYMDPSVILFFMHQCTDKEDIEDFASNINFPKTGRIFIPVNDSMHTTSTAWLTPQSGQHWSLLVVLLMSGIDKIEFWHFDSVRNSGNKKAAQDIVNKLQRCVFQQGKSSTLVQARTPPQGNGYDCGVHVLFTAELFASIQFSEDDALLEVYEESLQRLVQETPDISLKLRAKVAHAILQLRTTP
jgi:Ulp1 family protease